MYNPKPFHRRIALILLMIFIPSLLPVNLLYASNNGPNAPEAQGFEPVTATDMVNLSSGDMSYVLPVMDVNGFPVTLSYHGGIPLDLESSWVGLGWNLNTGAINRDLNATPDDWKAGKALDFIRYQKSETQYNVNVGVGVGEAAEIGVGMSWGSNKSLTGSVFASVGLGDHFGANASIDTDGNYGVGLSLGTKNEGGSNFGGGIGVSGNVNGGQVNVGVGAGMKTSSGLTMGMGTSLTSGGFSGSLGYSGTSGSGKSTTGGAGAGSLSMNNFTVGDWEISSTGWYIPIQVKFISFGFGKRKVKYSLSKSYSKQGYGILYNNSISRKPVNSNKIPDNVFTDYQNRFVYGDAYEQVLPQPEKEFIGDYDLEREKLNFTFAGYDYYKVNATGISGNMSPVVFDNATIFGMGYVGTRPDAVEGKQRVYYHSSKLTNKSLSNGNLHFYFDGQFTRNEINNPSVLNNSNGTSLLGIFGVNSTNFSRFQQGNYVETYTNSQIVNNQAPGLLLPEKLPNSERTPQNNFVSDGIGGYKITAPDGKIYHFSLPVYHFEEVKRTIYKDSTENHVSDKIQFSPYATHWLLTAITGPDYFDVNNNNIADEEDYGYWVRLEHGKWSDAYVWRSPTDKNLKDYVTNIESKIGEEDFGYYQFGRKQLYYLDKIVSNTHTAFFVKDLRYDSVGSDLTYKFTGTSSIENSGYGGGVNTVFENGISYKSQMQLMLKKIVLVKNTDANVFENSLPTNNLLRLNTENISNYLDNYNLTFRNGGNFAEVYPGNIDLNNPLQVLHNVKINQEQNVIDVKDFESFDYSKAVKVVEFNYNYNLAVKHHNYNTDPVHLSNGSPGVIRNTSINPNHGKLTLKEVKFLGRENFDYMPPYKFDYDGEFINENLSYTPYPANAIAQRTGYVLETPSGNNNQSSWSLNYQSQFPDFEQTTFETPIQNIRAKDEWGFFKDRPQVWTLTKITTPTGAKIEFEHEEDDFYTEAFSRRYWMSGLQFSFSNKTSTTFDITIRKNQEENYLPDFDFRDYFSTTEPFYFDFWLCVIDRDAFTSTDRERVDSDSQAIIPLQVNSDNMVLRLSRQDFIRELDDSGDLFDHTFRLTSGNGSEHPPRIGPRGNCPGSGDGFNLVYKVLASKVPQDETGGGIRVKSITLKDENNNSYKTSYYYNIPGSNTDKNAPDYKSSGITSYSPVKGTKFVPYQSELPSPGVMYEYVTMKAENNLGQNLGKTVYRFYVLRPVFNIFDENIDLKYDDGTSMFKAETIDHNSNSVQVQVGTNYVFGNPFPVYETQYFYGTGNKIKAKSINLKVNTSLIGQFRTVEEYNNLDQLMSKTDKHYISGQLLKDNYAGLLDGDENKVYRGTLKESFQSMKSIFNTNKDDNNPELDVRLLSISSRETQPSALTEISNVTANGIVKEFYKGSDPLTGTFNIIEKKKADGKWSRIQRIPAYSKYPELGSKVNNLGNKNMLTQETMTISSVKVGNTWKTTDASITTWNNNWSYRNEFNGIDETENIYKVWRKHKTFVWKDELTADGAYSTSITNDNSNFNWGLGEPLSEKWQKISEITRYTRWSSPIETKDINGNFASTKMADNETKVIVSGNSRYSEMYYSGAEYVKQGNLFEGEVKGADYRTQEAAHTGDYSVKAQTVADKVFEVNGYSGDTNYYQNQDDYSSTFRPGKYKVSFWAYKPQSSLAIRLAGNYSPYASLKVNGVDTPYSEVIDAGCWQLQNYIIDVLPNTVYTISVGARVISGQDYYDDFRMHPISSTINSFVYDLQTDELAYVLDANNLGTAYKYDKAGRLTANYSEVTDYQPYGGSNIVGGFKLVSQYRQKYKGSNDIVNNALSTIDNCVSSFNPLRVNIKNECIASFENKFHVYVSGGSGNFSYQYKWKTNFSNDIYSNYINGTEVAFIPYVPKYCSLDSYDKVWDFVVKVTDLVTGEVVEKPYDFSVGNCNFEINEKNWVGIQISKCNEYCGTNNYSFKVHLKDIGYNGNFKYEYAVYDPTDPDIQNYFYSQNLNWIDVTQSNGDFCPPFRLVNDNNCPSGFRKMYYFTYRITNLNTGEQSYYEPNVFVGECLENCNDCKADYIPKSDLLYLKEGNVLVKDEKGTSVVKVYHISETIK